MIIINFKNYVHGKKSLDLAKLIEKYLPQAIVAVPSVDISTIASHTKLKIFAQHVDISSSPQKSTGFVTLDALKSDGAQGTLLNHSEHQISLSEINMTVGDLREAGLKSVVCAPTLGVVKELLKLANKPDVIAFEDVELIATGKSITEYRTNDVEKFVSLLLKTKIIPLCGAGISSADDVKKAFELGCKGVLISSAIVNAPLKKAEKLLRELREFDKN